MRRGSTTHGLLLVASVDGLEDKEDAEQEAAIAYLAASSTTFLHCHDARRNQDEKNSLKGMMINEVYHHKQKLISIPRCCRMIYYRLPPTQFRNFLVGN